MERMKKICVITNGYPTKDDPVYAFIQPVVQGMADAGVSCTVIAPQSITKSVLSNKPKRPYRWVDKTENGNEIIVFQPTFISLSSFSCCGVNFSTVLRDASIRRCFRKEKMNPDVLYAHFWDCGIAACQLAEDENIPVFVATGESKIRVMDYYRQKVVEQYLHHIKGVIAVSTKNLNESRELGLLKYVTKTIVLPNAVNPREFYQIPREKAREKLGYRNSDKIAIFVGAFSHRKGVLRVVEAVERVHDLKLILIGSGEEKPESTQILYSGKVPHNEIVTYLNAADVFVLPTLAEGCCNAIVEALVCGVPVISSDISFNYDILDSSNSIMVDPENIDEISDALGRLIGDDTLRNYLSEGAQKTGKRLSIQYRCKEIIKLIGFKEE